MGRKPQITSNISFVCVCGFSHTETFNGGVKLSKEDLEFANELWNETINPACIDFERHMGKPTEAMCEAITGVIMRHVNQHSSWNAWQKVWWQRLPKVTDEEYWGKSITSYNYHLIKYICRGTWQLML